MYTRLGVCSAGKNETLQVKIDQENSLKTGCEAECDEETQYTVKQPQWKIKQDFFTSQA